MGKLVLFTGAGLSAESGLSTFRGAGGLWNGHDVEEVCDLRTWKANFEAVHDFYDDLRVGLARVRPNAAHAAVAAWEARYETENMTTNVDDLLERAGCGRVLHLHGSLRAMHCTACGERWPVGHERWAGRRCAGERRPCGSVRGVKPDIVFFNEMNEVRYGNMRRVFRNLADGDVVVVIGSSCRVPDVLPLLKDRPGFHLLANLTRIPGAGEVFDHAVYGPATTAVAEIDGIIRERLGDGRPAT